jgi:hypothetical protein
MKFNYVSENNEFTRPFNAREKRQGEGKNVVLFCWLSPTMFPRNYNKKLDVESIFTRSLAFQHQYKQY